MATRNLDAERQALGELTKAKQYQMEGGKSPELERDIQQKVYGTKRPVFRQKYGLDELEGQIDEAVGQQEQRTAREGKYGAGYEQAIKEYMPSMKYGRKELEAKYGNKEGKSYIEDPFAREQMIDTETSGTRMTMGELLNRAMGAYRAKTSEQTAALAPMQRKYERALGEYQGDTEEQQRLDEMERLQAQQEFENQMAMMSMQGRSGGGGGGGSRGGGGGGGSKGGGGGSKWQTEASANRDIQDDIQAAVQIYKQSDPNSNISETQLLPALRSAYGGAIKQKDIDQMFYSARSPYEGEMQTKREAEEKKMQSFQEPQRGLYDRAMIKVGDWLNK